jgi:hypothetical protein
MTDRVLIHYGKHYDTVYDASTPEATRRALATIMLTDALYLGAPSKPQEPATLKVEVPLDAAPGQVDAILEKARKERVRYTDELARYEQDKAYFIEFRNLVEGGVDALAPRAEEFWYAYYDGGEYNRYEIETVNRP